jgi:hypothetical protein
LEVDIIELELFEVDAFEIGLSLFELILVFEAGLSYN